jgi:hypothetical protein
MIQWTRVRRRWPLSRPNLNGGRITGRRKFFYGCESFVNRAKYLAFHLAWDIFALG